MMADDLEVLTRAHGLFAADVPSPGLRSDGQGPAVPGSAGELAAAYRNAAAMRTDAHNAARGVDAEFARILADAVRGHERARLDTAAVLAAARADRPVPDNPIAARELLRRRMNRLHAQRGHVLAARRRARRRRSALAALRYRMTHSRGATGDARADSAVRTALSRLGCPYVWGATGPDRFDCSGLVQWSYAKAGVPLPRTTYDQINVGLPVARADVRPGDLVFPHTGHVQMAIGNNLVVEAPYSGAPVRIAQLGSAIAIRRPG
ncbi:MAG TPA: C40 family peptidase [Mycobacterium sp.]|uniref:C40 family peptidase n=1 Tax=Mycolicibacterium sp. TaxID=2320850 RepID=UPI0025F0681F|nr:C40 family peptidase [Mycolicibacterium sp.]HPX38300.1 C40 family peptidase [Mycobacterium sp.]HQC78244.1 C40 family peptidase [Mycobacterium sp.]